MTSSDVIRIGAVFVLEGQRLVGIFTERDYLHKVRLQEKVRVVDMIVDDLISQASKETTVEEVMTKKVRYHTQYLITKSLLPFLEISLKFKSGRCSVSR